MTHYPILLREYKELLDSRVASGELLSATAQTYLEDVNRLFESLIWAFPVGTLTEIASRRFKGENYGIVARRLKALVNDRSR